MANFEIGATLAKPTIHLNGTGREALSEGYASAYRAVNAAIDALPEAAPNARDYYVQGSDAIRVATAEHCARVARLQAVRDELYALYEHCELAR